MHTCTIFRCVNGNKKFPDSKELIMIVNVGFVFPAYSLMQLDLSEV